MNLKAKSTRELLDEAFQMLRESQELLERLRSEHSADSSFKLRARQRLQEIEEQLHDHSEPRK